MLQVLARPHVGRFDVIRKTLPEGLTLAEIAAEVAPDMPNGFWTAGVATIDDSDPIPPELWIRIRPKEGRCVSFCIVLQGGGALRTIAAIGIAAAQAFAYTIPGFGPLLATAIGLGGQVLLGLLADKPKSQGGQKPAKQLGESGFSDNVLAPYEQIPTVLGSRRVPARYIAPPYVTYDGDNSTGTAILGLAGRHEIRDAKVDGGPLDALATYVREGDLSDLDPQIYTDVVWQEAHRALSTHNTEIDAENNRRWTLAHSPTIADMDKFDCPKFSYFRLGNERLPDRVVLDFSLDQGLTSDLASGKGVMPIQLCFLKDGETTVWLPQLFIRSATVFATPIRLQLIISFGKDPGGWSNVTTLPWREAFANTLEQSTNSNSVAHSYYGSSYTASHVRFDAPNLCTIYAPPETLGIDGTWRLAVRRGCGADAGRMGWTQNLYNYNNNGNVTPWWFGYRFQSPNYRTMEDQAQIGGNVLTLNYVSRIHDIEPLAVDGIATFEVQTQNQRVDQLTIMASRYVEKRWDGSAWVAEPHPTSNPAELAYDILTNNLPTLLKRPLDASLIDDAEFGDWADWCKAQGFECNAYLTDTTIEDALQICFQAGHAYLRRHQKWGVYLEKDRTAESPVYVYSPRNSRRFTVEKSFDHKPHALRVSYDDEDDDFQTRSDFVVYAPGYDASTATLFESVTYPGITREWLAERRAQRDLAIIYYRDKTYSLETDLRFLVTERGSLVGVAHQVLNEAHGFAAIRAVKRQVIGGVTKITGIVFDGRLEMQSGTTGLAISTDNGVVTLAQSTNPGQVREIDFSPALADDPYIKEGCTVTSGAVGTEYLRCIVDDIQPGPDGTARLTLVDEAPMIFQVYGY